MKAIYKMRFCSVWLLALSAGGCFYAQEPEEPAFSFNGL